MRESLAVVVTLATTTFFSIVMTLMVVASVAPAWLGDAFGMLLAWLWIPLSVIVHELAHRTVLRRHGVDARLTFSISNIFGGSTTIPPDTPPEARLRGVVAGPLTTMALGIAALPLCLVPGLRPMAVAALLLGINTMGAGVPYSLDGRHMTWRWRIVFMASGAAVTAASLLLTAYMVKYG